MKAGLLGLRNRASRPSRTGNLRHNEIVEVTCEEDRREPITESSGTVAHRGIIAGMYAPHVR
jgi:hypothetical protein